MVTNYQRGRQFEYRVRDLYKKHGWYVLRSAGSKTVTDLVAISQGGASIHFIQCKADGKVSLKEIRELIEKALQYSSIPVLAVKKKRKVTLILPDPEQPVELVLGLHQGQEAHLLDRAREALTRIRQLEEDGRKVLRF